MQRDDRRKVAYTPRIEARSGIDDHGNPRLSAESAPAFDIDWSAKWHDRHDGGELGTLIAVTLDLLRGQTPIIRIHID
ncbi:hypothetical protein TSA6c_02285 [Azospirillum sp. TSA6c]|nr:hypothetical protein TSA6c_02285 [Azospirillum sp. TSA6c]